MQSIIYKTIIGLLISSSALGSSVDNKLSSFIGNYSLEDKGSDYEKCREAYTGRYENGSMANRIEVTQRLITSSDVQIDNYLAVAAHQPIIKENHDYGSSGFAYFRDMSRLSMKHRIGLNNLNQGQIVLETETARTTSIATISNDGKTIYFDNYNKSHDSIGTDREYTRLFKVGESELVIESGYQINDEFLASYFKELIKGKVYKKVCYFKFSNKKL